MWLTHIIDVAREHGAPPSVDCPGLFFCADIAQHPCNLSDRTSDVRRDDVSLTDTATDGSAPFSS